MLRALKLLLFILILSGKGLYAQLDPGQWLSSHKAEFYGEFESDFPVFDSSFYANEIFLLGELHGNWVPQNIDLHFLRHLAIKTGLRTYLAEMDPSQAWCVNRFLHSGIEDYLKTAFQHWERVSHPYATQELYDKIKSIREMNLYLKTEERISFLGIDRIQSVGPVRAQLQDLLGLLKIKDKKTPALYRLSIQAEEVEGQESSLLAVASQCREELEADPKEYEKLLGFRLWELRLILQNLAWYESEEDRATCLIQNFENQYRNLHLEGQKMCGLWDFRQIMQAPLNGGKFLPLAWQINHSDLPCFGKVVSLNFSYLESSWLMPSKDLPVIWQEKGEAYSQVDQLNNGGPMIFSFGIKNLKALTREDGVWFFKLSGEQSPFNQLPLQVNYAPVLPEDLKIRFDERGSSVTDYFQYIILTRGGGASKKLEP